MRDFLNRFFAPPMPVVEKPPVFAVPEGVRVYAVGDVHGRKGLLARMLATIEADARAHPDKKIIEVFLGDYIDRGFHSREVIDLLLAPSANGHERICLMGNHEEVLLQFIKDPRILREWANFGGYATLASYGVVMPAKMSPETLHTMRESLARNIPETHVEFLRNLRMHYTLGNYLFVHAGIWPKLPLAEQKNEHMLWIREPFLSHAGFFDHYVVHGHSPVAIPDIRLNRANLDISIAAENSLCCLVLEGVERKVFTVSHNGD